MSEVVSIHAAKTNLSKLVARAEAGEEIIIARGRTPVAKLTAVAPKPKRVFGALLGDPALSVVARNAITNPENEVFVSAASAWEITTRFRIGKLPKAAFIVT